jgi:hypothetical protein
MTDNPEWTDEDFAKARPASELPTSILDEFEPRTLSTFQQVATRKGFQKYVENKKASSARSRARRVAESRNRSKVAKVSLAPGG